MPSNKTILTQKTSVEDVVNFFKTTESKDQVRARDLGNNQIELYVRKDSFKQFFTDKLRPDFLVKRDYLKAQNHILSIIKKADPAGENSSAFTMIKKNLGDHKHDFYSNTFSMYLDDALYRREEIALAKNILELDGALGNSLSPIGEIVNSKNVQQEISKVMNAIKNPSDKKIFERNFTALRAIMEKHGPGSPTQPTVIDYKCAIDFFRVWLKEIKNINSGGENLECSKPNIAITTGLTAFAEKVDRRGVPDKIDLNGGKFENSDADLIIFDESMGFAPFTDPSPGTNDHPIKREAVSASHDGATFMAITYPEKQVTTEKDFTAGFGIFYLPDQKIDREFMDSLYEKIENSISEKISRKPASSSKLMAEYNRADEIYTIHLPVINPFYGRDLKPTEKTMIQKSFAEATQKWLLKYPSLRIKVNLAEDMNISSIQASYRNTNKAKITN